MDNTPLVDLPHPLLAWILLGTAILAAGILWHHRAHLGKAPACLLAIALLLLSLAAGGLRIALPTSQKVQVMIDLSPSTRGASWRNPDTLGKRLHELLGDTPYQLIAFGQINQPLPDLASLAEIPSSFTRFAPPEPWPVLLFSDGQFEPPASSAPVYPVFTPDDPPVNDARIVEIRSERGQSIAIVENTSATARPLSNSDTLLPAGRTRLFLGSSRLPHTLQLAPGDLWPENDSLSSLPDQPRLFAPWLVDLPIAPGFRPLDSAELPATPEGYSFASLVALDASSAARLSPAQQQALTSYVRDLGGSLLLVGQDAQWTDLRDSSLAALSPLAVDPPQSATEWVVLLDASGSMAQPDAAGTKWNLALKAAATTIANLPAHDSLRIGAFATDLTWWDLTTPTDIAAKGLTPPAGFTPRGPTNLQSALDAILRLPPHPHRQLLLLTDAEVELPSPTLAQQFQDAHLRLSCLLLSDGRGRSTLEHLCRSTDGLLLQQTNPARWFATAEQLARNLAPRRWQQRPTTTTFLDQPLTLQHWNLAWAFDRATLLARTPADEPLAARWQVGLGQVAAAAFPLGPDQLSRLADTLTASPLDPQWQITWPSTSTQPLTVDTPTSVPAPLTLRLIPADPHEPLVNTALQRTAPNRYEATIPTSTHGALALLLSGEQVIARHAFAPHYPSEFEHLGVNRANLDSLAQRTSGQLITADQHTPIPFHLNRHYLNLAPAAGLLAAATLIPLALLLRRRL